MNSIDVRAVIDRSRIGGLQVLVLVLCAACLVIDGFDVQAISYVAPTIIAQWNISKAELGPVFSAGLIGMAVGAFILGSAADRIGRRPVLIGAVLGVAICMFVTAYANTAFELIVLRFLAGIGMGIIIPNAGALVSEFSPARIRVSLVMITSSGFILGGVLGGAVAAVLIPTFGWRSVFIASGLAPLVLGAVMLVVLPESPRFLIMKGRRLDAARRSLARIDPTQQFTPDTRLIASEEPRKGVPLLQLFASGLGMGTAMMWIGNFMNLLCVYFLANWLPVIMSAAGYDGTQAVLAGTLFWAGGMVGNILLGWFIERRGFGPTLATTFLAGAMAIALVGQAVDSVTLARIAIVAAGLFVLGGQTALNALAAEYYPTAIRATGMSWALGVGRLGSILGPLIGAELLRHDWAPRDLFTAAALPALLTFTAIIGLWLLNRLPARAGVAV